jgi:type VI secretion system secreted protein Hcp
MAAFDYFLKIDGIEGESADRMHKGEIDLESWSWGETQQHAQEGGGGAGKVRMTDLTFTAKVSQASPKLFLSCAEGNHIKAAWLTARRAAGKAAESFLKWTFSDVLISSYQTGADAGEAPVDHVSFNFAKIEVEYKEQKPDGSFAASIKTGWDLKANKKI